MASRVSIGRDAETIAAEYLEADGFRILWRNVRIGALEIDLVAKRDDLVVIVEVKMRGAGARVSGLASVTWKKQQLLLRAARGLWRGRLKKMPDVQRVRMDVIAISPTGIEWIRGAFTG